MLFRKGAVFLTACFLLIMAASACTDSEQSTYVVNTAQNGQSFTLMVYMCGSNLESEAGYATDDINEMLSADYESNVHVILETGGASEWQNDVIDTTTQRYLLSQEEIDLLEDRGDTPILDPDELTDFIDFCTQEYPADRYGLILWDHGGGTLAGFGMDERYPDDNLTIEEIADAVEDSKTDFSFIGFDACLMATLENACALSDCSDYLIASEEYMPATGLYYSGFLSELGRNPGISIPELADRMIDDYFSEQNTDSEMELTLSVIDLSQISSVLEGLDACSDEMDSYLRTADTGYQELSSARASARSFGSGDYEQIDLEDYLNQLNLENSSRLISSLEKAVVLNRSNIEGCCGLSLYYPYSYPEEYEAVSDMLGHIGMSHTDFYSDFLSFMTSGQSADTGEAPFEQTDSGNEFAGESADWFDDSLTSFDDLAQLDSDELMITEKGDGYVLRLSDEDWDLINRVELQVYVDDGEGWLELGSDDFCEFDEDGDLIVDFDYTWIHMNDCLVPYYADCSGQREDGSFYSIGYAYGLLNDNDLIKIWVIWEEDGANVLGYTKDSEEEEGIPHKGYYSFQNGDLIDFTFDYYDYDDNYDDWYTLEGNSFVYKEHKGIEISYQDIGFDQVEIYFYLEDVYRNSYWTEPLFIIAE